MKYEAILLYFRMCKEKDKVYPEDSDQEFVLKGRL